MSTQTHTILSKHPQTLMYLHMFGLLLFVIRLLTHKGSMTDPKKKKMKMVTEKSKQKSEDDKHHSIPQYQQKDNPHSLPLSFVDKQIAEGNIMSSMPTRLWLIYRTNAFNIRQIDSINKGQKQ